VRGLSYIVLAGLSATLPGSILASCGSEFTTSDIVASGSGGSSGASAGGGAGVTIDASATGGSAGSSNGGNAGAGGIGTGGTGVVDASLPGQCATDADCDDKNVCTGKEICRVGKCVPGAAMACAPSNNPCTTNSCDPVLGCVSANNTADCNDGNMCTTGDKCSAGVCKPGTVKPCAPNQVCDAATGACKCALNTVLCNNACVPGACCPGALSGACGRCGMLRCNDQGTAFSCINQHGTCDPGWTCSGVCTCPAGGDCSCMAGLHRDCDPTCNVTGCK
jgi:hypothetical protein